MGVNSLTNEELKQRLVAAQARRQRAAMVERRLQKQIAAVDRKLAAQQKITLGAALLRAAEKHPEQAEKLKRWLQQFITRDVDRACLAGTPFAFEPAAGGGDGETAQTESE